MTLRALPSAAIGARPGLSSEIAPTVAARWVPTVHAEASDDATISILDPIGADMWGDGVTAKRVSAALRSIGDRDVTVTINSPGGDYFEGLAIYNLLAQHKGRVTTHVVGVAASAASIIAMASDELLIGRAAFLMIHNTWVVAGGDRHDLREVADWLEPFDGAAAEIYAARSGLDTDEVSKQLDRETWMSGTDAVETGYADGLLPSDAGTVQDAPENIAELSPLQAIKRLETLLASGSRASKSERRRLLSALQGGKPGAAPDDTSRAVIAKGASALLAELKAI